MDKAEIYRAQAIAIGRRADAEIDPVEKRRLHAEALLLAQLAEMERRIQAMTLGRSKPALPAARSAADGYRAHPTGATKSPPA